MTWWHELLGTDYLHLGTDPATGVDCAWVCWEVLRREGLPVPDVRALFSPCTPEGARDRLQDELGSIERWERIGNEACVCDTVADLVLTQEPSAEGFAQLHVSALVSPSDNTFLTAHSRAGVMAIRGRHLKGIVGVYRLRRQPVRAAEGCPT